SGAIRQIPPGTYSTSARYCSSERRSASSARHRTTAACLRSATCFRSPITSLMRSCFGRCWSRIRSPGTVFGSLSMETDERKGRTRLAAGAVRDALLQSVTHQKVVRPLVGVAVLAECRGDLGPVPHPVIDVVGQDLSLRGGDGSGAERGKGEPFRERALRGIRQEPFHQLATPRADVEDCIERFLPE